MNTVNTIQNNDDEVLVRFMEAEQPNLAEWMQQYPTLANEFARFASARWAGEKETPAKDEMAANRVREIGLGVLRSRRAAVANTAQITSLVSVAAARGMNAEDVATKLDIPYALFFKLHRRLIALESIPQKFIAALSETLGRQAEEIMAYLRQPPTLAMGSSYRADDKPTVSDPESFAVALQDDPSVTEEQKARWLNP